MKAAMRTGMAVVVASAISLTTGATAGAATSRSVQPAATPVVNVVHVPSGAVRSASPTEVPSALQASAVAVDQVRAVPVWIALAVRAIIKYSSATYSALKAAAKVSQAAFVSRFNALPGWLKWAITTISGFEMIELYKHFRGL